MLCVFLITTLAFKYTLKERIFFSVAYVPKTIAVATVGSIIINEANQLGLTDEYVEYGKQIQTTSIIAIIFTLFIGCFLIDFLGPRFLTKDADKNAAEQKEQVVQAQEAEKNPSDDLKVDIEKITVQFEGQSPTLEESNS